MNIILVAGAKSRGRTLAPDWRRWAAAIKHPWSQGHRDADVRPQYGRIVGIDHGNGMITRDAHALQLNVGVGDRVMRGQRVAAAGTPGRTTGPHLHDEVRLRGVPQNPARLLQATG